MVRLSGLSHMAIYINPGVLVRALNLEEGERAASGSEGMKKRESTLGVNE